jgi:hypothetical protein
MPQNNKFWTSAEKTLCWKASIEKTGPAKLRYQNENFIVAPSSSTAKDSMEMSSEKTFSKIFQFFQFPKIS